jgi:hypothetical protein
MGAVNRTPHSGNRRAATTGVAAAAVPVPPEALSTTLVASPLPLDPDNVLLPESGFSVLVGMGASLVWRHSPTREVVPILTGQTQTTPSEYLQNPFNLEWESLSQVSQPHPIRRPSKQLTA